MNNYIILDGKRYRTAAESWEPNEERPLIVRRLMSGGSNVTFGPATFTGWRGVVVVDVSAVAPFGTPTEFRTTYRKRDVLSFTDHFGNVSSVVIDRSVVEKSVSPMHDAPDNTMRFNLALIKL